MVVFSKKARNYCFSFTSKLTNVQTNLADVEDGLDRVWNDSGSEGSISDSDQTPGNSNSDSESEEWSGDSTETSESSDTKSGNESEESDICYAVFLRQF